jgi:hypothetical protein
MKGSIAYVKNPEQNRLSGKFCAEHFGHCTIDGEVIGLWRTPLIKCDQLQEGKHVRRELKKSPRPIPQTVPPSISLPTAPLSAYNKPTYHQKSPNSM